MKAADTSGTFLSLQKDPGTWNARDVMDTAWIRGELEEPWTRLLRELASEKLAAEQDLPIEEESLQNMSEEFRYQRDLLTAEETEKWLAARNVGEDDFGDYFARRYWHERLHDQVIVVNQSYANASPEMRELLRVDLVLSGAFDQLARALSWRLAAMSGWHESGDASVLSGTIPAGSPAEDWRRFAERLRISRQDLSAGVSHLGRDMEWVSHCAKLEAAYQTACEQALSRDQQSRCLSTMRLPLTRAELETFAARSLDAAKEAVLCLRGNEASITELAAECGATCRRNIIFLGDCGQDLQHALLCASPGEILEPEECEDGFTVCRVVRKWEPDLDDEEVRGRVAQRLLEMHFGGL